MQITAVDHYRDLFAVHDLLPDHIVAQVLNTDWINMPWQLQQGQETWLRRRIDNTALPWMCQWEAAMRALLPAIEQQIGRKLQGYQDTAWWLDEPGFTCSMHTDGEMPGAMQLTWVGATAKLGTAFYHYKNPTALRHQFECKPNTGYIMINTADSNGARHLQWHAMLTPVPADTFRLSSYTWLSEQQ